MLITIVSAMHLATELHTYLSNVSISVALSRNKCYFQVIQPLFARTNRKSSEVSITDFHLSGTS